MDKIDRFGKNGDPSKTENLGPLYLEKLKKVGKIEWIGRGFLRLKARATLAGIPNGNSPARPNTVFFQVSRRGSV